MNRILFILLMAITGHCTAQITIDTTKTTVTVREKAGNNVKTMTIYRSYVDGQGIRNQIVYQPVAAEFGEEPPTLKLNFSSEIPHIKTMLDAAFTKRKYNFSRISINMLPYSDLMGTLADIYITSPEWNEYLKKANLTHVTRLYDGTEITEVGYDSRVAASVLSKSNFLNDLSALFAPYGYTVSLSGFPNDHQQTIPPETLAALGKKNNLVIPMPENFFILTKVK